MSGWRSAWRSLTRAVNCPTCDLLQQPGKTCAHDECRADISKVRSPLHGLRFHDLRHHAITELAESHASERTIMAIAGHISPRMLDHYSHIRMDAKRRALEALSEGGRTEGYGTKDDTNLKYGSKLGMHVTERNGGDDGTRTRGLCRDRVSRIGVAATYKTAGTAKVAVRNRKNQKLWVGLWVGNSQHNSPMSSQLSFVTGSAW